MKLQKKIGCSIGAWAIGERFAIPPIEILVKSVTHNKPVWEHVNLLLNTGEPKGIKRMQNLQHPKMHVIVYFDGASM